MMAAPSPLRVASSVSTASMTASSVSTAAASSASSSGASGGSLDARSTPNLSSSRVGSPAWMWTMIRVPLHSGSTTGSRMVSGRRVTNGFMGRQSSGSAGAWGGW